MPIPSPKDNEKQDKYMGRCMEFMKDEKYPQKQKVAICLNTFRGPQKKAKAEIELDINNKEITFENRASKIKTLEIDITETEAFKKAKNNT
jgi:hypothetical protein